MQEAEDRIPNHFFSILCLFLCDGFTTICSTYAWILWSPISIYSPQNIVKDFIYLFFGERMSDFVDAMNHQGRCSKNCPLSFIKEKKKKKLPSFTSNQEVLQWRWDHPFLLTESLIWDHHVLFGMFVVSYQSSLCMGSASLCLLSYT